MTLEIPDLDDRAYEELIEDLRKRIPVHAPQWTDHNAHDPGIALLELLAWLAETYGYQLDQVTDEHRRAYLRLLGERPRPPTPATAHLTAELPSDPDDRSAAVGTTILGGTGLDADDGTGAPKRFETAGPLVLTGASIARVVSTYRDGRSDNTTASGTDGLSFRAFGPEAEPGSAMHLGFDADPFAGGADVLDLRVTFAEAGVPPPAEHGDEASTFEPSVRVDWEYLAGDAWYDDDAWRSLPVATDGTNHLHRGGRVRLGQPGSEPEPEPEPESDPWTEWRAAPRAALGVEEPLFWLRATVTVPEPEVEQPPVLPCGPDGRPVEPTPEPIDPARLRYDLPPQLDGIEVNVLAARHRMTRTAAGGLDPLRGVGGATGTTARPNQRFAFDERPVLAATVALRDPDGPGDLVAWEGRDHLAAAAPDERAYVLAESAGEVRFGDNLLGAVPPAGREVVPTRVVSGGGVAGNVPASTRWTFADAEDRPAGATLDPVGSATGGRDAESVDDALVRARRGLRTPFRCVSLDDYRQVATSTPGLRFGRATALVDSDADSNPRSEGCGPHGRVRVVVVPYSTVDRPEPSQGFLDAVERHVCEHALLTDRVAVDPPNYVGVRVTAEVRLASDAATTGRVEAVRDALDGFLDPLSGFEGEGWPFGRSVYRSEVYEVIDGVSGVDCAVDVDLAATGGGGRVGPEGDVDLDPAGLVYPLDHGVLVRTDRPDCGDDYRGVS